MKVRGSLDKLFGEKRLAMPGFDWSWSARAAEEVKRNRNLVQEQKHFFGLLEVRIVHVPRFTLLCEGPCPSIPGMLAPNRPSP